jgi:hypothetical protein
MSKTPQRILRVNASCENKRKKRPKENHFERILFVCLKKCRIVVNFKSALHQEEEEEDNEL